MSNINTALRLMTVNKAFTGFVTREVQAQNMCDRHNRRVAYAKGKLGGTDFVGTEDRSDCALATTITSSNGHALVWTSYGYCNGRNELVYVVRNAA